MYVCTSNIKIFTAFDSLFGDDNLKLTLLLSKSRTGCFDIALDYCLHITEGFQPSQNIILKPWDFMGFFIIQMYFHTFHIK